jgi:trimeric autotransporter adhesin
VKVNGSESHTTNTGEANTVTGIGTLQSNTTGSSNTANGYQALFQNTTGSENTATGAQALLSNTTGIQNTAHGAFALFKDTTGSSNTATGDSALFNNTTGNGNTATGFQALFGNTTGVFNTATGEGALGSNTTGSANTAIGDSALGSNTTGGGNSATGQVALASNTTGSGNTAHGQFALASNTIGASNTAVGFNALGELATGNHNTALGLDAGTNVTTADNVICIRHPGANVSGTNWIGNIYGVSTQSGTTLPVVVSNGGQLGTASSSRRFKKEIEPMDKASESILALKPVTFHYKNDAMNTPQFGLIAEEVAEVNPDLIVRNENDEIYTVRYDAINAMLLNEFLKEHKKVGKLEATLEAVNARLREQAAQIQKVTAQVDATKPLPHLVLNNP